MTFKLSTFLPKFGSQSQLTNPAIGALGDDPTAAETGTLFIDYAIRMWRAAIYVGALIVLAYYVWAGVEWISSGSDTKGVESAKKRFTQATIGLILLVSSFALVAFVSNLLFGADFDLLRLTIPTGPTAPTSP